MNIPLLKTDPQVILWLVLISSLFLYVKNAITKSYADLKWAIHCNLGLKKLWKHTYTQNKAKMNNLLIRNVFIDEMYALQILLDWIEINGMPNG